MIVVIIVLCFKVHELDNSDVTPSRSPLGSTSPESVPEWVSDGYGSSELSMHAFVKETAFV